MSDSRHLSLPVLVLMVPALVTAGCLAGTKVPVEGLACADASTGEEPCLFGYLCDPGTSICLSPQTPTLSTTTIEVEENTLFADGVASTLATVFVRNAAGDPVRDRVVVITTTYGDLIGDVSGGASGVHTQRLQAPRSPGVATVGFSLDGTPSTELLTVEFLPAPAVGNMVLSATPSEIPADGAATTTISSGPVTDAQGNKVADGTLITVVATGEMTILNTDEDDTAVGVQVATAGGVFEVSLRAGTAAGTATLTAAANTARGATTVTLLPGAATALAIASGDGQAGTAGEVLAEPLRVKAIDAFGNGVPGIAVTWSVVSGNGAVSTSNSTTGPFGVAQVAATLGPVAGALNNVYQAESPGLPPVNLAASALPGAASGLVVAGPTEPVVVGDPVTIHVDAFDALGNRVVGYVGTVSVTSTDSAASLPAPYTFLGSDAGHHDFSVALNTEGIWSVTVTDTADAAINGTDPDLEALAPTQADDARSSLTASPGIVPGDGTAAATITVNLVDSGGGPVAGERVLVTATLGIVSPTADNGDGTYTATVVHDVAGASSLSFSANTTGFSATTTVTFTNITPVPDAGPDVDDAFPWDTVTLAGSGSDGNPGDRITHRWSIDSLPAGSSGAFGPAWPGAVSATRPAVDFWPDLAGVYVLSLTTTDPSGANATDTMTVTVRPFTDVPMPAAWTLAQRTPRQVAVMPANGHLGMVTAGGGAIYLGNGDWASLGCAAGASGVSIVVAPDTAGDDRFYLAFDDSPTVTRVDAYSITGCGGSTDFDTSVSLGGATAVYSLALDQGGDVWIGTDQNLTRIPAAGAQTVGEFAFDTPQRWAALAFSHDDELFAVHQGDDGYHRSLLPFDPAAAHLDLDSVGIDDITYAVRGAKVVSDGVNEMWLSTRARGWWRIPDVQAASPAAVQYTLADGLPSDEVNQATFDDATGDLWVATAGGLGRYKRDVDAIVAISGGGLCTGAILGVASDAFDVTTRGRAIWVACADQLLTLK